MMKLEQVGFTFQIISVNASFWRSINLQVLTKGEVKE